jgi:TonB-linked SusC/RagA family outer membrane protein
MSHSLQFSGGTDKIDFLLSGRFYEKSGIMKFSRDKYSAYNLRGKVNAHINSWLTISNNLQFSTNTYNYPGAGSTGDVNTAFTYLGVHMLPSYVPKNPDGTFTYRSQLNNYGIADGRNLQLQYGKDKSQTQEFIMTNTVSATIQPTKGLDIIGSYSYELNPYSNFHRSTETPWSIYPGQIDYLGTDLYTESASQDQYQVVNAYATYAKNFGSHDIKIMGGYNQEYKKYHTIAGQANDLLSQDLNALDLGTSGQQVGSNSVEWALQGYFGRINYSFKDKYLLELDGRYDGSSHFPSDSRWGFFPSISAGWRISQEGFFEPLKNAISELKIRGSYGSLGNQSLSTNLRSANYPYIPVMGAGLSNWLQNGDKSQYLRVGNPITPQLTWERTTSTNIGMDIGFLNNRLTATIDLYDRKTLDMLVAGKTLPAVFGAASPKQNAANLDTKGYDLSIQWQDRFSVNQKTFSYNVGLVLSNSESHITKFDNPSKLLGDSYVGQRIGDIWGYTVDGYFESDDAAKNYDVNQDYVNSRRRSSPGDGHNLQAGDLKFVDLDGNKIINNGKNTLADHGDLRILGNRLPRFPFGITAAGSWNGFSLSVFLQGVGRQDWYPGNETYLFWGVYGRPYYSFIPKDFPDKVWSPENPNAYFPKLRGYVAQSGNSELTVVNTKYLQNIGYVRLKNLTVGYDLPVSLLERWKINKVKIYLSGENIFTVTGLESKYVDPEQVSADASGDQGDNNARNYPFFKSYSCGLNVTF